MLVLAEDSGDGGFKFSKNSNRPFATTIILFTIFALSFLIGCDLDAPSPISYSLPGEEVLRDLPFRFDIAFAIAWHPDGNRLAVAERAGAEATLMGLTVTNPRAKSLNLSFRYLRRFAAISQRQVVVGETPEGELWAWSLQGAPPESFFDGPIQTPHWSLSESGEDLIYVPTVLPPIWNWQVRYVNLRSREESVLIDSARSVHELKILPDGSGALISYSRRSGNSIHSALGLYPLPSGQPRILLQGPSVPSRITPSPDGKKIAFVRTSASRYDLMIYDLREGFVDSLISIREPSSDLVWMKDERWIAMMDNYAYDYSYYYDPRYELRAYNIQSHGSTVLAQNLPFSSQTDRFGNVPLFSVGDTLAFLTDSPQRVSVFDRRNSSFSTWFSETAEGNIRSLAWDATGEKILIHSQKAGGISTFYVGQKDDWTLYQKDYSLSSVSLLPDGQNFLAISTGYEVKLDALAFSRAKTIFRPKWHTESMQVQAHPSGGFAGVIDRYYSYDPSGRSVITYTLRVLDLSSYAVVDTLALPGSSGEWQWMKPANNNAQLTGIWRANGQFYYVSLDERRIMPVYRSAWYVFAVVPGSDRFSVLQGDVLRTMQISAPAP
jgi:Tol biopolymer transport system component